MSYLSFENNIIEASGSLILKSTSGSIDCSGATIKNVTIEGTIKGSDKIKVTSIEASLNDISFNGSNLLDVSSIQVNRIDATDIYVDGSLTVINTIDLDISDNIIGLNRGHTGASKNTSGVLINYGDPSNVFFGYHETQNSFVIADTSFNHDSRNIVIDNFVDLKVGNTTIDGSLNTNSITTHTGNDININDKNFTNCGSIQTNRLLTNNTINTIAFDHIIFAKSTVTDKNTEFVTNINIQSLGKCSLHLGHTGTDSGKGRGAGIHYLDIGNNNGGRLSFYAHYPGTGLGGEDNPNFVNQTIFYYEIGSTIKNVIFNRSIESPSINTDNITNKTDNTALNLTTFNGSVENAKFTIGELISGSTYKNKSTVMIEAPSFNATSDYRTKTNIEELDENITVSNLRPLVYLKNDKKEIGLLAHELQEVYPFMVCGEKDGEQMQSVNYNNLIGVLINDVKRLTNENNTLKSRLDSLEEKFIKKFE